MNVQTITDSPRADAADEITITAPELPPQAPADRIENYLTENPPSPLTFHASRPLGAVQDAIEKYRWHTKSGREILAVLLSRGRFDCARLPMNGQMSIADLVESEYAFSDPVGYENQLYARHSAVVRARDAIWKDARIQALTGIAEHLGLTQRQVLAQINQAVAAEGAVLFRRIGIAKR